MDVIVLSVYLYQLGLEIGANLGENMSQCLNNLAVEDATTVFCHEDQMHVHSENAMSTVPKVLYFAHRPEYIPGMEKRQVYKFDWVTDGKNERDMRRFAEWRGGTTFLVPEPYTSQQRLACGHTSTGNRKTQELFLPVECGFRANADFVDAVSIKEAELACLENPPRGVCAKQERTEATEVRQCA